MEGILHPEALVLVIHPEEILVLIKETFIYSHLVKLPSVPSY